MRLALLVLLLIPCTAYAMPPAFFIAIGISAGLAGTLSTVATVLSIALTIGTTVFGAVQQKKAAKKAKRAAARAREDFLNSLQERTVTRIATDAPHRYVYGRARVGSDVVATLVSGGNDEYTHLVCVHAAHECDAIEEVYIDGKALGALDGDGYVTSGDFFLSTSTENITETFATSPFTLAHTPSSAVKVLGYGIPVPNGPGLPFTREVSGVVNYNRSGDTITVTSSPSSPYQGSSLPVSGYRITYQYQRNTSQVRVKKHLVGTTADASLLAECPGRWTSSATLTGLCYTVIRLDKRQAAFQGGVPSIEVLLRGKKLYDLRTGLTAWSQNNALAIYDYLTSDICGVDVADLPPSYFITAANVCDEAQAFGARYTINGTVTSDEDQAQILEAMADSMAGSIVSTTWEVTAGKYVAPIASLSQSDIVGSLAVTPGISDADIINGVRGQNITAANLYVATDYAPYQNATYLASDGKDKFANVSYPFTDTKQRAHNLARILVEDMRNGFTVKAEFSLKAWDLRIGDRITFTSALIGQAAKVYRISDKKYAPDSSVELTMKEDTASIWDFADTVNIDDTPNTNLPDPFVVPKLSFLTLDSGTDALLIQQDGTIVSRIKAVWNTTTQAVFSSGIVEMEWKRDSETVWRKTTATGSDTGVYLSPVEDGTWYVVRGRAVNPYLNIRSDWTYADLHQVIGKSEPPDDITDLQVDGNALTWAAVNDLDLAGYVFRYHLGSNLNWSTATPLHNGIITSAPFTMTSLPYGSVAIMGKAIDTSGNVSLATANLFTNLGDAPVANVVETFSFDPIFLGEKSYCAVAGGQLIAGAQDSFYADDAQSFYGSNSLSFYKPSTGYRQMVYTTNEIIVSAALAGSKLTLDLVTLGADVTVEYRLAGDGSFYGADADPFYEAGTGTASGPSVFDAVNLTGFSALNPNSFAVVDVANFDPTNPDSFLAVEGFSTVADDSFYGAGSGVWRLWPGQVNAKSAGYQFRVTIGSGTTPGSVSNFDVIVDSPDIVETISNLTIGATATTIPYTKNFTAIKVVNAQLQSNGSGAESVEINKTSPLAPTIQAYNGSHVAVSGATADILIQGY